MATACSIDFRRSSASCFSSPWTRMLSAAATGLGALMLFRSVRRDSSRAPLRRCFSRVKATCRVNNSSDAMPSLSVNSRSFSTFLLAIDSEASLADRASRDAFSSCSSCLSIATTLVVMVAFSCAASALVSSTAACAFCTSTSSRRTLASAAAASPRSAASISRLWTSNSSTRALWDFACSSLCASSAWCSSAFSRQESHTACRSWLARCRSCSRLCSVTSASSRQTLTAFSAASRRSRSASMRLSSSRTLSEKSLLRELRIASIAPAWVVSSLILLSWSCRSARSCISSSSRALLLCLACSNSRPRRSFSARCSDMPASSAV
mmetsp:Transcript_63423/g.163196  ORF Transcript_63423/g.163196 Transcript_63423/m.163196 type:complete len:323 (-) Transcript_63423:2171-3139(-)